MRVVIGSMLIVIFLTSSLCSENRCDDNSAPEINFELLVGGEIIVVDENHKDITSVYFGTEFVVHINKIYCDGTIRGPFEEYYLVAENGSLNRIGIGTWGFRMDNTEDIMKLKFFIDGNLLGEYILPYSIMQKYNNDTGYFEFVIYFKENQSNKKISDISISLKS